MARTMHTVWRLCHVNAFPFTSTIKYINANVTFLTGNASRQLCMYSCLASSQHTSPQPTISARTTLVAALFPSAMPLHTRQTSERGSNVVFMRAKHRTTVRSTPLVMSTLTLQHLVRPAETVSQLCDPAPIFPLS